MQIRFEIDLMDVENITGMTLKIYFKRDSQSPTSKESPGRT